MMVTKHALCHRAIRGALLAALSLVGVQVAHAAAWTHTQGQSGATIDWNSGLIWSGVQWVPTVPGVQGGPAGWTVPSAGGMPTGSATLSVPSAGNVIDVQAKVVPNKPSLGAALGNFAKKVAYPLTVASALYDLGQELGFLLSKDAEGNTVFQKADASVCTVAPCYEYLVSSILGGASSGWQPTVVRACEVAAANYTAIAGGYSARNCRAVGLTWYADIHNSSGGFVMTRSGSASTRQVAPSPAQYLPSNDQEFADAIAAKSGWPTSSAIARATAEAIEAGEPIQMQTPTITGPASVPGPTTTTQNPDGSTVQRTTNYNYNYAGNTYNYTTNITTVTTSSTGQQTTTTEQTDDPQSDCEKNPGSLGCADLDVPESEIPKTTKNVTFSPVNLGFGGGVCPADKFVSLRQMAQPVKVFDWQDTCGKLQTYVRPMLLALATFAALMIVIGAKPE